MQTIDPQAWSKFVEATRQHWLSDPIAEAHGRRLYYTEGTDGSFMMIDHDGLASAGVFKNSDGDIRSALFIPAHQKKFDTLEEADAEILKAGGQRFIRDILGLGDS